MARWAETINYEIVTGLSRRLPRLYLRGGEVVEAATLTSEEPRLEPALR